MIGYDVAARIRPGEDSIGLFDGADMSPSQSQSKIDDIVASMGRLPKMTRDVTGNVAELTAALSDAAELAGKMHGAGGISGRPGTETSLNDAIALPPCSVTGEMPDSMSAIFAAQINGFMMSGGAGPALERGERSDLETNNAWRPDATATVSEYDARPESLERTQNIDGRSAQLQSIMRTATSLNSFDDGNSDDRISADRLEKFFDLKTKSAADPDEDMKAGGAFELGSLAHSVSDELGGAAVDAGTVLEQNDGQFLGSGYRIDQAFPKGEDETVRNLIDDEIGPRETADFSSAKDDYYPLTRVELSNDAMQDFAGRDGLGRNSGEQQFVDAGMSNAGTVIPPSWNLYLSGDETRGVEGMPDLSGLWGMLRDADRVLPKASFAAPENHGKAAADLLENVVGDPFDSLAKLVASGIAGQREKDVSNMSDEKAAPVGSRSSPTGHRNDPIYTVAVGAMTGTLMPMVPTPGTSTRSPPIPGQRNLP